jgi:hypothetical protein
MTANEMLRLLLAVFVISMGPTDPPNGMFWTVASAVLAGASVMGLSVYSC